MKKRFLYFIVLLIAGSFQFSCSEDDGSPGIIGETGRGGSTARFAIAQNTLYTVDNSSLRVFSLATPSKPVYLKTEHLGRNIETIFPRGENLFIGSQEGVFIYSIQNPQQPNFLSTFRHIQACDPVVANDNHAFVTLRSFDNFCGRND